MMVPWRLPMLYLIFQISRLFDLYRNNIRNKGGQALASAVLNNAGNVHFN